MGNFVHLRLHSEFSINDSIIRIPDAVKSAGDDRMVALALTDLHNTFGLIKFYKSCREHGIKPIVGAEINMQGDSESCCHKVIFLAKNLAGYQRLCELITRSYTDNKILDVPYVKEEWFKHSQVEHDLIMLSGAHNGDVGILLREGKFDQALDKAKHWAHIFADNYYLELQRIVQIDTSDMVEKTIEIALKANLPVVATHPIQFIKPNDYDAHEVRVCIADGDQLDDEKRKSKFGTDQYFLNQEQMIELFSDIPSSITNTIEIAKRCNFEISLGKYFLPNFTTPNNIQLNEHFSTLANRGLNQKLKEIYADTAQLEKHRPIYAKRLEQEIETIIQMDFAGYFLIVADFIDYAKKNGIPVGPGRGSGAGSLVAFVLGITDIEPLRYGLLFERFLNSERVSMPDFDIDFCQDKREQVIDYVKNKYGAASVAQIATFGTMSSKAVIKDVGRALGIPYGLCDSISKLIINTPAKSYSLLEAYAKFSDLKNKIDGGDDDIKRLWELSLQLEDIARSVGKHAAGVLIAPSKLTDFCALYLADGMQTSQLDKDDVESVGLVKFDFLGLRNLTIIQETLDSIKILYNKDVNLSYYEFDDPEVYKLLQCGNTAAIFQLESNGMKRVLTKLEPDRFEDIVALLALYRPGPLGSGMVDDFIKRKKGEQVVDYFHEDLKECLEPTYGVIVYQEQVMQISQIIGGYTLGGADLLRRAMGKKKPEEMAKHKTIFIQGAVKNNYSAALAENLFDLMAKFGEYGFNKSHSAAYAVISYHTAYLKAHYLSCFMSATLSSELDKTDKLYEFYVDCISNDITILPPDINYSNYKFTPINDNTIRYALGAIKGVGANIVELLISERDKNGMFTSFYDFCSRVDKKVVNKKALEGLIKAGAFDIFEPNRAKLYYNISKVMEIIDTNKRNESQGSLFDQLDVSFVAGQLSVEQDVHIDDYPKWTLKEMLSMEKQALGFYFSASLFDEYKDIVHKLDIKNLSYYAVNHEDMQDIINANVKRQKVLVCGIISNISSRLLKRGGKMTFVNLEDDAGSVETVVFDTELDTYKDKIKLDEFIFVEGELMYDSFRGQIKVTAKALYSLDEILAKQLDSITLNLSHQIDPSCLSEVIGDYGNEQGLKVMINYTNIHARCKLYVADKYRLLPNYNSFAKINQLLGKHGWSVGYSKD